MDITLGTGGTEGSTTVELGEDEDDVEGAPISGLPPVDFSHKEDGAIVKRAQEAVTPLFHSLIHRMLRACKPHVIDPLP